MGTISDKLTYLNTTKGNIKDAINLTGANILSEDTFRSYADKLKQGLVDAINDGGSTIYSNFPKTTGEGTEIALNGTYEAPMEIGLKGNTHQDSYTGINLLAFPYYETTKTINGITFTVKDDGTIHVQGTASARAEFIIRNRDINLSITEGETYTLATSGLGTIDSTLWLDTYGQSGNFLDKWALSSSNPYASAVAQVKDIKPLLRISVANGATVNSDVKVWLYKGTYSSSITYEPYCGGIPSPNPDFPQQIEVVTGDNTINVHGKNLAKVSSGNNAILTDTIQAGTYTFSLDFYYSVGYSLKANDGNGETIVSRYPNNSGRDIVTFTINTPMKIFINGYSRTTGKTFAESVNNYQLEQGSTATPYEPYQSKDYEINLKSKNLFDKNTMTMTNTFVNPEIGSSNGFTSIYTPCTPNTTYTISKAQETSRFYVGTTETLPTVGMTATVVSSSATGTTKTFTTGANANYIVAMVKSNNDTLTEEQIVAGIQIEENSTATDYEEFYDYKLCKIGDYQDYIYKDNGKWYKHSEIGKYVYNNDLSSNGIDSQRVGFITPVLNIEANLTQINLSNRTYCNMLQTVMVNNTGLNGTSSQKRIRVYLSSNYATTYDEARAIFANNNLTIYYGLETPTNTEITDTDLIDQLEELEKAKSVDDKTFISQINEQLLFILDVSALSKN